MSTTTQPADQLIREQVRSIIVKVAPNPDGLRAGETQLVDDLEYHSLSLLELGFTLEDAFELPPLDQARVQDIRTVTQVEDLVVALMAAGGNAPAADAGGGTPDRSPQA